MKHPYPPLLRLGAGSIALLLTAAFAPTSRADPVQAAPSSLSPLDQLTAPIALYPDPLIALILPAATVPSDIADAASYLNGNGDPSRVDVQPWDPSVRGLAHYPNVLKWMADNPDWTAALGAAFSNSPAEVMDSIQRLRGTAKTVGSLEDTPQQNVVDEDGGIAIQPADPNVIYVPSYDPALVFVAIPGYDGPYLTFGAGCPVGVWLAFQFDWHSHAILFGDWRNWHNEHGWSHPVVPGQDGRANASGARQWSPSHTPRQSGNSPAQWAGVERPHSMPGAPPPPEPRHGAPGGTMIRQSPPAWQDQKTGGVAHPNIAPDHSKSPPPSSSKAPQNEKERKSDQQQPK